jgi:malate synthase
LRLNRIEASELKIAATLAEFIAKEAAPQTGFAQENFWEGLAAIVRDLGPRTKELLAFRDTLQSKIDGWHRTTKGRAFHLTAYTSFLQEIGYLLPEPASFCTADVDKEIGHICGPQLVIPLSNARYALNAAKCALGKPLRRVLGADVIPRDPSEGWQGLQGARRQGDREGLSRPGCAALGRGPRGRHR